MRRHERPAHHPRAFARRTPGRRRAPGTRDRTYRAARRGKRGLSEDIRDVYNDIRAAGYDTKCVRQIVRLRRMKPEDRRQMEAILDVYKNALGLD
jgi:uncharacterized protein (UPF0335 family)